MECRVGFVPTAASAIVRPSLYYRPSVRLKGKNYSLRAKLNTNEDDPLFQAPITRFHETNRPDPLFVDPYAGCFVPPNVHMDMKQYPYQYCLATRFIDDKLLNNTKNTDGVNQVVLLTDGMDTRPYRLSWSSPTIIFDISPEIVFKRAAQKLEDVKARIPRSCLFLHVPLESSDIQQILRSKGFTGNRPSIWVLQGLPVINLVSFKEILFIISNLATKGSLFLGELPAWLVETEIRIKSHSQGTTKEWIDKLFMGYGFRVDVIGYEEVARSLGKDPALGDYKNLLFVAEHLRLSDDQMETWRKEFQRVEEEGDEEGFEEF